MSFRDVIKAASNAVNSVLGATCTYHHKDGAVTNGVDIIINRNKAVMDNMGIIAGYRCEASILRSEIPKILSGDYFVEEESNIRWEINMVEQERSAKWYVNIIEV